MLSWTLSFLSGIVFTTTWSSLPAPWIIMLFAFSALVIGKICPLRYRSVGKSSIAFLLGMAWCCYKAYSIQLHLPPLYFKETVLVSGRIVSFPDYEFKRLVFIYRIEKIFGKPCKPFKVLLTQYNYNATPLLSVQRGEYWQLSLRLKRPRGFWNVGSFDYQAWLLQRNIVATGTLAYSKQANVVNKKIDTTQTQHSVYQMLYSLQRYRLKLYSDMRKIILHKESLGLLQALILGIRREVLPKQWETMRATGTNHLFSISGLHVGFIGGIVYSIICFIWRRLPLLCLRVPMQQAACLGSWLSALLYSTISGFELPIQRTMIMVTVLAVTVLQRRIISLWQGWCIALIVLLLINPFIVLSGSFWLSFGAVAIIFYSFGGRLHLNIEMNLVEKLWKRWGRAQWIISMGLLPVTLWFFQQLSLLGIFANLIAIPSIGLVVLPISLCGILLYPMWPSVFGMLLIISEQALRYLWSFLEVIAAIPASHFSFTIPDRWAFLGVITSALLFISPAGFPSRLYLAGIGLLPTLLWKAPVPSPYEFWLTLLDVGQGLSVIVQTNKHVLVYDTGPRFGPSKDAGEAVVLPYLRSLGIRQVDMLIVSHGDDDHSGGVQSILKAMPVKSVLTSEPSRLKIKQACHCRKGQVWQWEGVKFDILHPTERDRLKSNDGSCVLRISNNTHQVLLPGDIHKKGEKLLINGNPDLKSISLLVAPHHGSKTSSSIPFIEKILPKHVLFAVGPSNRFKFPHASIVRRYSAYGIQSYSTAKEGMITVRFNATDSQLKVDSFYRNNKRFWYTSAEE